MLNPNHLSVHLPSLGEGSSTAGGKPDEISPILAGCMEIVVSILGHHESHLGAVVEENCCSLVPRGLTPERITTSALLRAEHIFLSPPHNSQSLHENKQLEIQNWHKKTVFPDPASCSQHGQLYWDQDTLLQNSAQSLSTLPRDLLAHFTGLL